VDAASSQNRDEGPGMSGQGAKKECDDLARMRLRRNDGLESADAFEERGDEGGYTRVNSSGVGRRRQRRRRDAESSLGKKKIGAVTSATGSNHQMNQLQEESEATDWKGALIKECASRKVHSIR